MKSIFLYGIGGARDQYRVIRYTRIDEPDFSINTLMYEASIMRINYPSIEHVYAVDNRYGLGRTYQESVKRTLLSPVQYLRISFREQALKSNNTYEKRRVRFWTLLFI